MLVIVAESLPVGADHSLESIQHPTRDTMGSVHMYRVYTCTVLVLTPRHAEADRSAGRHEGEPSVVSEEHGE